MHKECFPEEGWKVLRSLKDLFRKYDLKIAGGTALALHLGHRISRDIDMFTGVEFKVESLISWIRKSGYTFRIISEAEGHLTVDIGGIKVSFFKYDYPFIEKPVIYRGVQIAGIHDIVAMKIIAISQRGTKRDFIDMYFVLQDIPFHKLSCHMVKRFGKERINPVHIGKSLVYFSDAESDPEPEYVQGREVDWDKVKKFFKNHVKQFVLDLATAVKEDT
jgi:Nucleotidyl transferase AbiEii toxin, Type IV TA system